MLDCKNIEIEGVTLKYVLVVIPWLLMSCSTAPKPQGNARYAHPPTNAELVKGVVVNTGKSVPTAIQAPLKDFNLMQDDIPQILLRLEYPYRLDGPVYCDSLVREISELNFVLGNSADIYETSLSGRELAAEATTNAAQAALEDLTTDWIPYRSVLRRLTGATAHERATRIAFERGRIRRAFLKGVGGAFNCPYPARPSSVREPLHIDVASGDRP